MHLNRHLIGAGLREARHIRNDADAAGRDAVDLAGRRAHRYVQLLGDAAGRQSVDAVIRNILPFMAFTATILGIITATGLGDVIAHTVAPMIGSLPGMILLAFICGIPFISPILGPGAVIAQLVGVLAGDMFASGAIAPQLALPALFAIDAQVGCDFVPVGLSLGEAEPETVEYGVPAVLYERIVTGPIAVLIGFILSIGLYA